MSDSASRKDVEDVLSSVRRLVSSELPRNRRPDLPKGPGALVLTDAQRVERPTSKGLATQSLEDRIAELEAAVSVRDDDFEPDGSEDQAQHRPDRIVYTRPPSEAEQANARGNALRLSRLSLVEPKNEPVEASLPEPEPSPPVSFRHSDRVAAEEASGASAPEEEAPMAEDVIDTGNPRAEVRPFHNPDEMVGRFEARMDGAELPPLPGPGYNGFGERLDPYESADAIVEGDLQAAGQANVVDDVDDDEFEAALSEAVRKPVDDMPAAAEPEAETEAQTEAVEEPRAEAETPGLSEAVLDALDEETLRPIVARLIREELQGELGERITRNVRKLVRREILRAINARDFE